MKATWPKLIGLDPTPYPHVVILYLPNRDKNGKEFDIETWDQKALELLARLFRGATSYPSRGSYKKIDSDGEFYKETIMIENTRMVVSFVAETDYSLEHLKEVSGFMRQFKAKTSQDTVAIAIDGEMHYL